MAAAFFPCCQPDAASHGHVAKMNHRNSVGIRIVGAFSGVIFFFGIAIVLSMARITSPMLAQMKTTESWAANVSESMRHARNMLITDDKNEIQGELDKIKELD